MAMKKSEGKTIGEKERYTHLNAEFQRIARRDKKAFWGRSQDGREIGRGDHFLPYKSIERTIQGRANFKKQLLITS